MSEASVGHHDHEKTIGFKMYRTCILEVNMKEMVNIGCTPNGEDCVQVGTSDYLRLSTIECRALIHQLCRIKEPTRCTLSIKSFPHDFGTYKEVVAVYDDNDEAAEEEAFSYESLPERWDAEARKELKAAGYPLKDDQ